MHKHQGSGHKLSVNKCMRCSQLNSMRSVDHACWLSHIGTGMRAFILWTGTRSDIEVFSRVLDGQLVSAVLRSSVGSVVRSLA